MNFLRIIQIPKMAATIKLVNLEETDWTQVFRLGSDVVTAKIPPGQTIEVLADDVSISSAWVAVSAPSLYARGSAPAVLPDSSAGVEACIWMLAGVLCAIPFWKHAHPFR